MATPAPLTRRFVTLDDGLRLSYLETGPADAPPFLFLHGWPTNAHLWRNVVGAIADRRRCVALDLPGFGGSDQPSDASYSFRFFTRALDGFLAALDIDDAGLAVHDLGGPIGLYWATQNPARVRELAVFNTIAFPDLSLAVKLFVVGAKLPGLRDLFTLEPVLRGALRFGVGDPSVMTRDVTDLYTRPFRTRQARLALAKAGCGLHPDGIADLARGLPSLARVPKTLIYGGRDRILPHAEKTMRRLSALWPDAPLTALPTAGHFLQEDAPERVGALLSQAFHT